MFLSNYHSFYYISLLGAALVSGLLLKKTDPAFKWLAVLIIYTVISEFGAAYLKYNLHMANGILYHIYTPVEFSLYAIIYSILFKSKKWNRILIVLLCIVISSGIINVVFFQPIRSSNTNIIILESVILIFLSLSLFNKIREESEYKNILKESIFWFNCIVLLYYPFTVLIWGFHSIEVYLLKNPPIIIYYINLLFSGVLYLVFATAIILNVLKKAINSSLK